MQHSGQRDKPRIHRWLMPPSTMIPVPAINLDSADKRREVQHGCRDLQRIPVTP